MRTFTDQELEAYLDEALPSSEMAEIESSLRRNKTLLARLSAINGRREAGMHAIGDIWRRHRLSCAGREELGSYLLGTLDQEHAQYLTFHIERVGCRTCRANLEDLRRQQREAADEATTRRSKYFQSSAGYLRRS